MLFKGLNKYIYYLPFWLAAEAEVVAGTLAVTEVATVDLAGLINSN